MPLTNPLSQLGVYTTLYRLIRANMDTTADQIFEPLFAFTRYSIREINAVDANVPITAVGGIYSGAGKTGTQIVAEDHSWGLLSSPDRMDTPALDPDSNDPRTSPPYLSLTTPQGSAATASFYIMGVAG